jgi:uncharacterized protein YbbK (DUF523 family)
VDWVACCPEVLIGLGTPREPIRLTAAGRLVNRAGTADHTAAMEALPLPAAGLEGYVFKAKSPSCVIRAIPRYGDDETAVSNDGCGLYAGPVLRAFPLVAAEDEGRLNDAALREAFCERIFAAARLRSLLGGSLGHHPCGGHQYGPRCRDSAGAGVTVWVGRRKTASMTPPPPVSPGTRTGNRGDAPQSAG